MENLYPGDNKFICKDCSPQWSSALEEKLQERIVCEYAHEKVLTVGYAVTQIKNLKVRSSSFFNQRW